MPVMPELASQFGVGAAGQSVSADELVDDVTLSKRTTAVIHAPNFFTFTLFL